MNIHKYRAHDVSVVPAIHSPKRQCRAHHPSLHYRKKIRVKYQELKHAIYDGCNALQGASFRYVQTTPKAIIE
jgi:hypothetical protein